MPKKALVRVGGNLGGRLDNISDSLCLRMLGQNHSNRLSFSLLGYDQYTVFGKGGV